MPAIALGVLCTSLLIWMLLALSQCPLTHTDEQRTAERSREFLFTGDPWVVTENFNPSFNKPPLQYWLTAPVVSLAGNNEFSVRFWPALFGVASLLATASLAGFIWPEEPWAGFIAAVALALNTDFLTHSRSAMLDPGQTLFCTLTLLCALKAVEKPRWWILAGLASGLGCLQKSPLPAGIFIGAVALLLIGHRAAMRTHWRWLASGLAIGLGLALLWPMLQFVRFGPLALETAISKQILTRLTHQEIPVEKDSALVYVTSYWTTWRLVGVLAIVSMTVGISSRRFRANRPLLIVLIIGALYLALVMFVRPVYPRYLLPILPVLAAGLAGMVALLMRVKIWGPVGTGLFLAACLLGWQNTGALTDLSGSEYPRQVPWARALGAQVRTNEQVVLISSERVPLTSSLFLYYGGLRHPVTSMTWRDARNALEEAAESHSVVGVMASELMPRLRGKVEGMVVLDDFGEAVLFRVGPDRH